MHAPATLQQLRRAGFSLSAAAGRLLVTPASNLTTTDREGIQRHRDALLVLLTAEAAPSDIPGHSGPASGAIEVGAQSSTVTTARLLRMVRLGWAEGRAEAAAARLASRDADGDDRRMCVECSHLGDSGRCVAAATGRLRGADRRHEPVADVLERCEAFGLRKGLQ